MLWLLSHFQQFSYHNVHTQALECCVDGNLPLLASLALHLGNEASMTAAADAACAVQRRGAQCADPAAHCALLEVLRGAVARHSISAAALLTCCRCAQGLTLAVPYV